ncbi:aromatic compound degradation protein PaaI [Saccharomonospora sp. CUA-673]|uniref:hotdog fold thioesterase n=1 Tax=Saccharomonospora sp. CUA-673 TaxID=1904969 RepID=UPI000968C058|nr:hotdog fold thioesterase [Saccharomonospora sp. CUA-673]OLT43988.1 aromatic compound degradation protein PaaI [Saccharomonospora sp. CUA-673]
MTDTDSSTGSEQAFREALAGITPEIAAQQLNEKVGMVFGELSPERVTATMPVEGNLQPYGLLHGGANAVLAEALGSTVAALNAGEDRIAVGIELNCTHHRSATAGTVTGVATPLHVGRSAVTSEIVITDDAGRRTCTARLTCMVRDRPPSA